MVETIEMFVYKKKTGTTEQLDGKQNVRERGRECDKKVWKGKANTVDDTSKQKAFVQWRAQQQQQQQKQRIIVRNAATTLISF